MIEADAIFERMLDRITREAMREIAERIAQRDGQPDVPLHERGFGVMEEPSA